MSATTAGHLSLLGDTLPLDARVESYEAREGLSLPYEVLVRFSTSDASFRVDDLLQRRAALRVDDAQGRVRWYDGLPDRVGFLAYDGLRFTFEARLRPALAVLEHRVSSRIFQDASPVDVIKVILSEAGIDAKVEWRPGSRWGGTARERAAPRRALRRRIARSSRIRGARPRLGPARLGPA